MNNKNKTLYFKDYKSIKSDKPNLETLKNNNQDLKNITSKLKDFQNRIKDCKSIEELNTHVNLPEASNDLSLIMQSSTIINSPDLKKQIEEINQLYRDTEVLYFDKKFEMINEKIDNYDNNIEDTFKKSEENLKDITGGTLFSIASVFLGISLTSALVTGVQHIKEEFIILYFITCLLIAIITIGLSAIFMRKTDKKTYIISTIIILVSLIWIVTAFLSYKLYITNNSKNITITDKSDTDFKKHNKIH